MTTQEFETAVKESVDKLYELYKEAEYCEECGELFPLDQLDINWLCPTCAREEAKKHAEL